eukprot:6268170-Lingulodinium_polyedra.AAC.1
MRAERSDQGPKRSEESTSSTLERHVRRDLGLIGATRILMCCAGPNPVRVIWPTRRATSGGRM